MSSPEENTPSKLRMSLEGMAVWIFGSMAFTAVRLLHLSIFGMNERPLEFNPWENIIGMWAVAPFGWAILGWFGPNWLVILGQTMATKTRRRLWHVVTLTGTLVFGYIWPKTFWAWMSV